MPRWARWLLFVLLLLLVVLLPFGLFGQAVEGWVGRFIAATHQQPVITGLVLALLLVSDILLPVPSSVVSTAAGYLLGFWGGLAASFFGMSLGSLLGYWLGKRACRGVAVRIVGKEELERFRLLTERWGAWGVVVARPIPVLAEVSAFAAGISGMNPSSYLLLTGLANLGISAVYAATGAFAASTDAFLWAFGASVLLPGLGMMYVRRVRGEKK